MKVTIEIPDIDIYPNHDGTPTSIIAELKSEIIRKATIQIMVDNADEINLLAVKCKNLLFNKEKELDEMIELTVAKVTEEFQKKCDSIINGLKDDET